MGKIIKMNDKYTENDIRPHELDVGKIKALNADLKRLKSQIDKFIHVSCPACNSHKSKFEFCKYGFNFVRCESCRTVYMNQEQTKKS